MNWTKSAGHSFLSFSCIYAGLFTWAWIKRKKSIGKILFEYDDPEDVPKEELLPFNVSASDFPREMIPNSKPEDVELVTNLYEDNSIDDGYPMEQFIGKDLSKSPEILKKIRIQQ